MSSTESRQPKLRLLEFFSGIGGWHAGLQVLSNGVAKHGGTMPEFEVAASFDVNPNANAVYRANHPSVPINRSDLKKLTTKKLDSFNANVWAMSPPCQPHTRNGNRGDEDDPRSQGFLNLLRILRETSNPPEYFLLENVEGFETSTSRDQLLDAIGNAQCTYHWEEYILSPTQFGVPNQRDRYYFLARREPFPTAKDALTPTSPSRILPDCGCRPVIAKPSNCKPGSLESHKYWAEANAHCKRIGDFLVDRTRPAKRKHAGDWDGGGGAKDIAASKGVRFDPAHLSLESYSVNEKVLSRCGKAVDIVDTSCKQSCCFTKAYTKYGIGTGSLLLCSWLVFKLRIEPCQISGARDTAYSFTVLGLTTAQSSIPSIAASTI